MIDYWYVTNSTGSVRYSSYYNKYSTTNVAEGTYLKLDTCASGYVPVGALIYHCEYNSSTDTYEWEEVLGYSNGKCVAVEAVEENPEAAK